jgi:predicted nucleotidyltransferase
VIAGGGFVKTLDHATLTEAEHRAVREAARLLRSELPVSRVILFGSKARGDARPDSDIDLLILTSAPATMPLRDQVSERLYKIILREDVDLSPLVVSEEEWSNGLTRHLLIHDEVERDGCIV